MKGKRCVIASIDASKAFDKICRNLLWIKLYGKIGATLTETLINYYEISEAYIVNKSIKSEVYKTTVGTKQGGPLSPLLFSIYVEDIVNQIDNQNLGFNIGNMCISIILYADDINLLAETRNEMNRILTIVSKFGEDQYIKFNPTKTCYLQLDGKRNKKNHLDDQIQMQMDGEQLRRV